MTNEEIYQVAKDYVDQKIFASFQIKKEEMDRLPQIFMCLLFLKKEDIEKLKNHAFIYEYYDKASPSGINGYPIFFSARWINKENYPKFIEYVNKLKESENKLKEEIMNEN